MKSYIPQTKSGTPIIYIVADSEEIQDNKIIKDFINHKELKSFNTAFDYSGQISKTGKPWKKKPVSYNNISCGFDIETTNIIKYDEKHKITDAFAYMYHWQFSINDLIITGRTWTEFKRVFDIIVDSTEYCTKYSRTCNTKSKTVIWVANLGFEHQFLRNRIDIDELFARESHEPIYFTIKDKNIEFRDCLQLSGGSLESLAKDYTDTQKLVNDLDYSILRNSKTELNEEKEKPYVYNDVAILSEWHNYVIEEYISKGYFPLTQTGVLRHEVKKEMTLSDFRYIWNNYPSESDYAEFMQYVYKGGYSHSNLYNVCHMLEDAVYSIDFTSSYPAVMIHEEYPLSKFLEFDEDYVEKINASGKEGILNYINESISKKHYIIAQIQLEVVRSKSYNTYISYSKCKNKYELNTPKTRIDNGRILKADKLIISETELDILTIYEMYDFDAITILRLWECHKSGKLPDYLLKPLIYFYRLKAELKAKGLSDTKAYAIAKARVNSAYGMCCTKMVEQIIRCSKDNNWFEEPDNKTFNDRVRKQFLLPTWGIYICAYARRNLMKFVIEFDLDVVCCDTDSIYFVNYEKHKLSIENWNLNIVNQNNAIFDNDPLMSDLGTFEIQSVNDHKEIIPYKKFVTMGAKRYLLYGWNDGKHGYKQTIAGLPKGSLFEAVEISNQKYDTNYDPFEVFMNVEGFAIPDGYSKKKTTHYNNEPHEDYVEGELMQELTSVAIVPIPFTLSLSQEFKFLICELNRIYTRKFEKRIL